MVPADMKDKVEECLLASIDWNNGHISAGFIGANPVLEYLSQYGHKDLAFSMVAQTESPGWLHMVKDANSTMGENLNAKGYGSGHHPYGAHIGFWLFKYLGGIRPNIYKPGFQEFIIEPMFIPEMDFMTVKTRSLYGEIVSSWKREGNQINLEVIVPGNTQAKLLLPPSISKVEINGIGVKAKTGVMLEGGIWKLTCWVSQTR
jgi:alpha-L-rhamnosidase